jgi:hypothetical protein
MSQLQTATRTHTLIAMGFKLTSTIPIVTSSGQFGRSRINEMSNNEIERLVIDIREKVEQRRVDALRVHQ